MVFTEALIPLYDDLMVLLLACRQARRTSACLPEARTLLFLSEVCTGTNIRVK